MAAFKQWLFSEEEQRTTAKLGLYPDIMDAMGQYPPLYSTTFAADFITYYDIQYKGKGAPGKGGFVRYAKGKAIDSAAVKHL
jgi:hypothetical protein